MPKEKTTEQLRHQITVRPDEAAILLSVSKPTVYKLIHRADFPSFKLDAATMIPVDGLLRWAEAQANKEALL